MRSAVLLALLMPVAACAAPAVPPPATSGACNAEAVQRFVGMAVSPEIGADLLAGSGAVALRWIAHGSMVTMEFRADRLSVSLTADNKIEAVRCG